jgi:ethanolamine utilization protein EutQ (cupin superfamily)
VKVVEDVAVIGSEQPVCSVIRDEHLLLSQPYPLDVPIKAWRDHPLLPVVHFSQEFEPQAYSPPQGVYENDEIRIEWQQSDYRQPFYHRNCDVDEICYQIAGERTLITEIGVIEHRAGELSLIPRGYAHDNYGRRESHLLIYTAAGITELTAPERTSERVMPPYPGWQPKKVNEFITECMGTIGHDRATFPVDEQELLNHIDGDDRRINVFRARQGYGPTWMYGSEHVRLGMVNTAPGTQRRYRRTLDADEIQYQANGRRTLITQRGIVELEPGDFVRIPLGVAHASVSDEAGDYFALLSHRELPQIKDTARTAEPYTPERLAALNEEEDR